MSLIQARQSINLSIYLSLSLYIYIYKHLYYAYVYVSVQNTAWVASLGGGAFRLLVGPRRCSQSSDDSWATSGSLLPPHQVDGSRTTHYSPRTTHYSLLATHYSLLTIHYSLLTTRYSLLATHYSLLTSHFSLLTSRFSLFSTHSSPLAAWKFCSYRLPRGSRSFPNVVCSWLYISFPYMVYS